MSPSPATLFAVTPDAFWKWGRGILLAALIAGLLVVMLVAWTAPKLLPLIPLVLLGGLVAWRLFQHPLANLCVALVGFAIVADNEAGFQLREILYGLYLYGLLAHWYFTRVFLYQEHFLITAEDKALLLFLVLLPCTVPLTILAHGDLVGVASELLALSLLAIYFPLKEACTRYRHGPRALFFAILGIGLLIALRNVLNFQQMLSNVTQAWQVATGRVVSNDHLLMVGSLFSLTVLIFARRWWSFGISLGCFLLCFGGLLLTQSRGYWLAFLLGALAMFVLVRARHRKRMLWLGVLGLTLLVGIGFAFFGAYMDLLLGGLLNRFASVGSAASTDVSLINRFREAKTVMALVVKNPVLGYGMGVPYTFYDLAHEATDYDAFVHNGYVSLWYKFGLWGLGLVLFFWGGVIRRGVQAFLMKQGPWWARLCGLAGAICLIAFTLSTLTSNPFFLKDSVFIFGVLAGLAAGAYQRGRLEAGLRKRLP
jgi:O-antigen ligase